MWLREGLWVPGLGSFLVEGLLTVAEASAMPFRASLSSSGGLERLALGVAARALIARGDHPYRKPAQAGVLEADKPTGPQQTACSRFQISPIEGWPLRKKHSRDHDGGYARKLAATSKHRKLHASSTKKREPTRAHTYTRMCISRILLAPSCRSTANTTSASI